MLVCIVCVIEKNNSSQEVYVRELTKKELSSKELKMLCVEGMKWIEVKKQNGELVRVIKQALVHVEIGESVNFSKDIVSLNHFYHLV